MILDTLKNIKHIFLTIFLTKLFVLTINLVKKAILIKGKNLVNKLTKAILEEYKYSKKLIKKNILTKTLLCL